MSTPLGSKLSAEHRAKLSAAHMGKINSAETRAETITERKAIHSTMKEKFAEVVKREATIMLLDLTMPNGKTLRDCTAADCRKAGGLYLKIADKIGRKKVGAVLTEKQVRALLKKD